MRTLRSVLFLAAILAPLSPGAQQGDSSDFLLWAPTPPMGWNSWDCFGTTVTEVQTLAHADVMAEHLKAYGWQYIVVDIQWYEPGATGYDYRQDADLSMDEWGRLLPAVNRFPSAAEGAGFKTIADYVHDKGLKLGIHLMRGIPRQAVHANTPVKGTPYFARDIADTKSICPWNQDMYGVDMTRPGAQAYYDSVFALIASWEVDYVKVDDISRPYHDHEKEIEAIRTAIDKTGRPMVLSLSPGETALTAGEHVSRHANLWRISDDFWDNWPALYDQFERLHNWTPHRAPGHWPDADMLPLGDIDLGRRSTRFTPDEQQTLMSLWCIARSPLMHGGDMTRMDDFTLSLLTNDEVLSVNQHSENNRELFHRGDAIGWIADVPGSEDRYLALFNAPKAPRLREERALFASDVVTRHTPGHGVAIDVDIKGATKLYLVATDAGDGISADHVDWVEPRLIGAERERKLIDLAWTHARTGWQEVRVGRGAEGRTIRVEGHEHPDGIGAHAESVIEYNLPPGYERFRTFAALDDRGTRLDGGATVRFHVFTGAPFDPETEAAVPVQLSELGGVGPVRVRDLWTHHDLGQFLDEFAPVLPPHGAGLYRISPVDGSGDADSARTPTLYLIGDSTVKNGSGHGEDGLYGWGQVIAAYFDPDEISVQNHAIGGRSSRTFLTEGRWDRVVTELRPGDFVMMQFGHNDGGPLDTGRARASLKGTGMESQVITNKSTERVETVYTYGHYLRRYIADTQARGAHPIVLSPVPRNIWNGSSVARAAGDYGGWAKETARECGAYFLDLNERIAVRYETDGEATVAGEYFTTEDHTHTTKTGARVSAEELAGGIRDLHECPLQDALAARPGGT